MTTTERLYDAIQEYLEERPNAPHSGVLADIQHELEQEVQLEILQFREWVDFQAIQQVE